MTVPAAHLDVDLDAADVIVTMTPGYDLEVAAGMPGIEFGVPGITGPPGAPGASTSIFKFRTRTGITAADPGAGRLAWNHATQSLATALLIDNFDDQGLDVSIGLASLDEGNRLYVQEYAATANYQDWTVTSTTASGGYYTVGVTLAASGGTGTTGFASNLPVAVRVTRPGPTGLIKVEHGSNPNVPRPDAPLVYWVGTVQPVHADPDDLLMLKEA